MYYYINFLIIITLIIHLLIDNTIKMYYYVFVIYIIKQRGDIKHMSPTNEKNILVIGNGFDLYHGFPTKYSDFINFIKLWDDFYTKYSENTSKNSSTMTEPIELSNYNINKDTMLELANYYKIYNKTKIDTFNNKIKNNDWIDYFKDMCSKEKGWIDFEGEIETVIKCIQYLFIKCIEPNSDINKPKEFNKIFRNASQKYFKRTINVSIIENFELTFSPVKDKPRNINDNKNIVLKTLKKQLDDLIDCLNIYLLEFVSKMKPNKYAEDIKNINPSYIISFNYTNIFNSVYEDYPIIHHIHGKIGDENNMVLGMKDDNMNGDINFVYFYKYFQRIQKKTGVDYNKWLSEGSNNIYILGHSLDSTDKDILTKIITSENTKKVTILYRHQEEMEKFIINLLKLFSPDELIKFTSEEKIIFTKLEKEEL